MSIVKLLLLSTFFNSILWIVLIPLWQYPDEQAHFAQVQYVAEFGGKPQNSQSFDTSLEVATSEKILGSERDDFGNNKFTYHPEYKIEYSNNLIGLREQEIIDLDKSARTNLVKNEATLNPPLYYFLGSIFYKVFYDADLFARVYAVRIMSALIFLGTVIIAFKIGRLIFEGNKVLPLALTSLVAFKPMLAFASTGVLPDSLTNFLFSLVLFFSLKFIKDGLKFPTLALCGLTIFLGVSTRQQFIISILIVSFTIVYQVYKKPRYLKYFVFSAFIFLIYIYLSNTVFLSIPILTNFRVPEIFDAGFLRFGFEKPLISTFPSFFIWTVKHTISEVWPWYWGVYRWLSLTLPPIYYQILNRLVIISFVGIIIWLVFVIKNRKFTRSDVYLGFLILGSTIYFMTFVIWDYLFYLKNGFSFGIQGRYFFPLVVAHITLLIYGFWKVSEFAIKKFAKYAIFFIVLLMIIFNNLALFHVAGSYYDTSNINTFIIQASQYKPEVIKGGVILTIIGIAIVLQCVFIVYFTKYVFANKES